MQRREFLVGLSTVGAVASISGCASIGGNEPANTSDQDAADSESTAEEPIYQQDQVEELILPLTAFPEGWSRNDDANEEFDAVYFGENQRDGVLIAVDIGETVSEAREAFESQLNLYREPQELDIGDQAFWDTRDSQAVTKFRHSNAIGEVRGIRQVAADIEPAINLSQTYAIEMFDHWQSVTETE